MKKITKVLEIVNKFESEGKGFFSRCSNGDMIINIRGAHGNDPNQWINANELNDSLGLLGGNIRPDPMSGHLVLTIKNIYNK
jgi:hypothetical protein